MEEMKQESQSTEYPILPMPMVTISLKEYEKLKESRERDKLLYLNGSMDVLQRILIMVKNYIYVKDDTALSEIASIVNSLLHEASKEALELIISGVKKQTKEKSIGPSAEQCGYVRGMKRAKRITTECCTFVVEAADAVMPPVIVSGKSIINLAVREIDKEIERAMKFDV